MKIFIGHNFTCNLNYIPTYITNALVGNEIVKNPEDADVIIFMGTCACTQNQIINTLAYIDSVCSSKKAAAKVYVTGCIAKKINNPTLSDIIIPELKKHADAIIPYDNPDDLLHLLNPNRYKDMGTKVGHCEIYYEYGISNLYISNGCNNRCSFCKVNFLDFPLQSMPFDEVIKRIDSLDRQCIGHIYLKGTNIAQYGYDLYHEYLLGELLNYIAKKDRIFNVELIGYGFADGIRNSQETFIRENPKVTTISGGLESGSPKQLRDMNKGFTPEEFLYFVKECQRYYPKDYILNVMSGFPNETEDDINMTVDLLKEIHPAYVELCQYSDSWFVPSHKLEQLSEEDKEAHTEEYIRKLEMYGIKVYR